MPPTLTVAQAAVLRALIEEHGYAPTWRRSATPPIPAASSAG